MMGKAIVVISLLFTFFCQAQYERYKAKLLAAEEKRKYQGFYIEVIVEIGKQGDQFRPGLPLPEDCSLLSSEESKSICKTRNNWLYALYFAFVQILFVAWYFSRG